MVTLKDIAKEAGCSLTTVSIIANGRGDEMHISAGTQQRIKKLIDEMGYRPNRSAQFLRSKAPAHPVIAFYWPLDSRANLLGARLIRFQDALSELDPACEIVVQTFICGKLSLYLDPLYENRYSGAIIAGANEEDMVSLESLELPIPVPTVLMNLQSRKYSTVGINNNNIGARAAALIHSKGYKSCALVKSSELHGGTSQRTKAFLYNCRQLGIDVPEEYCFSSMPGIEGGAKATEEYCALTERPRVIYYENDSMAQGGIYTLQRFGLKVPVDVEVLCIEMRESESTEYLMPPVSSISIPPNVEKQTIALLLKLLKGSETSPVHIEMEPIVHLKESFSL